MSHRVGSRDGSRSVRELVLAICPSSLNSGQEPPAIAHSLRSDRKRREVKTMTSKAENLDGERADILAGLASARHFLRFTARNLTDEQARPRTTASALCVGGLIKHVA